MTGILFSRHGGNVWRMSSYLKRRPRFEKEAFYSQEKAHLDPEPSGLDNETVNHEDVVKSRILDAALNHVNSLGWNERALAAGAADCNYAEVAKGIFSDFDLVKYFISINNLALEDHLIKNDVQLRDALEWRLRCVIPYLTRYPEAMGIAAQPENVPESTRLMLEFADSVAHHCLKDKSTNITWYSKRLGVAYAYTTSELALLQDKSSDFQDTWDFLDRRVRNLEKLQNNQLPLPDSKTFSNISYVASGAFETIRNMMGMNSRR